MSLTFMHGVAAVSIVSGGYFFYTRSDFFRQEVVKNPFINKYKHHWLYKQLIEDKQTFQMICLTTGGCLGGIRWFYPFTLGIAASDLKKYIEK
jgi:hypothetical protein